LNFEPDFGQVRQGSGSNFGSGPNRGITNIIIHTEISTGTGDLAVYHSGEQVNHVIETDVSFSAAYLGITASGSASYSYKSQ